MSLINFKASKLFYISTKCIQDSLEDQFVILKRLPWINKVQMNN